MEFWGFQLQTVQKMPILLATKNKQLLRIGKYYLIMFSTNGKV